MTEETMMLRHAGIELYRRPKSSQKWYLPVCSAKLRSRLEQLRPNHVTKWEETDFDGCPTICYVMTGSLVKSLNSAKMFTAFFSMFTDCIGLGPTREFFPLLWIRNKNIRARNTNRWESLHGGIRSVRGNYRSMSIRDAASMSLY